MSTERPGLPPELPDAVLRLATARQGEGAFLLDHHIEAARRFFRLCDLARLAPRVTLSYDPARVGRSGSQAASEISDTAATARARLQRWAAVLPQECWGVLIDACAFEMGLQDIELARGWPRRSAKLVLRIGLDQLAREMGLSGWARGPETAQSRHWLPERPPMFADEAVSEPAGS